MTFRSVNKPDNSVHYNSLHAAKWTETKRHGAKSPHSLCLSLVLSAYNCMESLQQRCVINVLSGGRRLGGHVLLTQEELNNCYLKHGVRIVKSQRLGFIYLSVPVSKT